MASTKKMSRIERRARKEIGIVGACRDNYDDKVSSLKKERDTIKAAIDVLEEKIAATNDEERQLELVREIEGEQERLNTTNPLLKTFINIQVAFKKLCAILEAMMAQELYSDVVKKIPEKKLPKLVRDSRKNEELYTIINNLYSNFKDALARRNVAYEQFVKTNEHIDNVYNAMNEQISDSSSKKTEEHLKEILARKAKSAPNVAEVKAEGSSAKKNYS